MMGPYQTPLALAREPLMAFFWAVLAPILFLTGAALLAASFIPEFETGSAQEIQAYQTLWFVSCIAMAAWFAVMSAWSNWLGAGPFAGGMKADSTWIMAAAILGPLILLVPNLVIASVMTEEGWQYNGEVNQDVFQPKNWTLAFVFVSVMMAPIVEEVAFRGVALGALIARGLSPIGAVVLSSFAFAFSHLQYSPAAMLVVFLSGIGFAILRLMSGTVIVPIIAHASANAVILTLNLMASNPPT
ncbi:MAG: CPBP family intramembrane glutamic endopeptidase [Pseudomonadota bacterium]